MNVVFLDYDGVVNTVYWEQKQSEWHASINYPCDNRVNNIQAVQWVSEFCEKYDYKIVVSSTWRCYENWQECLRNAGLRPGIQVIGRTQKLSNEHNVFPTYRREHEIADYLFSHPEISHYLIFDDSNISDIKIENYIFNLNKHLVLCNCFNGFLHAEYEQARYLHEHYDAIE